MPIMHRGDLPDPRITAIRDRYTMPASTTIDTGVYIDIHIEAPDCQLYFTTDGSVPAPFKRWMGNREVTFRYLAPFALKSGKRVVRAVAVSRDGLLQSRVVSKTFKVIGDDYDSYDSDTYLDDDWSDAYVDSDVEYFRRRKALTTLSGRRSYSPSRPRSSGESGWIACTRRYPYNVETVGDLHRDSAPAGSQIPDGPFNPTNYSGTQINVWGAPPGSVWPAPATGVVSYGNVVPVRSAPTVQSGLLTTKMVEGAEATDSSNAGNADDFKPLTVAEARRIIAESESAAAESSASEKTARKTTLKKKPDKVLGGGSGSGGGCGSSSGGGNVSFSGLARSGKALLSNYRGKKK